MIFLSDNLDMSENPKLQEYQDFAREQVFRFKFYYSYSKMGIGKKFAQFFGVFDEEELKDFVGIIAFQDGKMIKYKFEGQYIQNDYEKFLNDFEEGNLNNYYRSKVLPENQGKIKEVVRHTFHNNVVEK